MSKFKIGDRVRNIELNSDKYIPYELTGTVIEEDDYPYVEWDEKVRYGHNADGLGKDGYCMPQDEDYLELVEEETKSSNSAYDTQVGANHYKSMKIQPMEYALANNLNLAQGNVVKYVSRYKAKNGEEDLRKAIHCIELLIEHEYGEKE